MKKEETNLKTKIENKARPQNEWPSKILSVNEKGLDSKDVNVDVDEQPLKQKQKQKHSKNMKQEE